MDPFTVLISSAGRRVSLLQCFRSSAKALGIGIRVLAVDLRPRLSPACALADHCFSAPRCDDPAYVDRLIELCQREHIDLVVPTIDTELQPLAISRSRFEQANCRVCVSDPGAIAIARDKLTFAKSLLRSSLPVPKTARAEEVLDDSSHWRFPLWVKPIGGSRSVGARRARTPEEVGQAVHERKDLLAQEECPGQEHTVNLYISRQGKLMSIAAHRRLEVRDGEVSKGLTVEDPRLSTISHRLSRAVPGLVGPICFQCFVKEGGDELPMITDLNPRFGGGYPLSHAAGAEFTTWLIRESLGQVLSIPQDHFKVGMLMLRYDSEYFVDPEAQD